MSTKKVTNVSDLRLMFHRNERPIYFISATNFNLLGIDEWVRNFHFINYIDCFDGRHPNVFVPQREDRMPSSSHRGHQQLPARAQGRLDLIQRRGGRPAALFLMFDEKTEELARSSGSRCGFPPAAPRNRCDNKMETVRIGNKAGVPSVPNCSGQVESYEQLREIAGSARLGDDLVIQSAVRRLRPYDVFHRERGGLRQACRGDHRRARSQDHEADQLPRLDARGLRDALRHDRRPAADGAGRASGADPVQGRLVRQRGLSRRLL